MPFVLGQCPASDDEGCPCCDHSYDAGRFEASVDLLSTLSLPHDWSLGEAMEKPLSQGWLAEHFLPLRESMRDLGESEVRNYPLRQTALTVALLDHAPWSSPTRRGVAWATTRLGMRSHGWKPAWTLAMCEFLDPRPDLFEEHAGMLAFSALLGAAYYYDLDDV
jgi:hypothetical protein